jgi:hypothetical protein
MDYEINRKYIAEIAQTRDGDGSYRMVKSDVWSAKLQKPGESGMTYCGVCKHWKGKRGIAVGGKWIFKSLVVYVGAADIRAKCEISGVTIDLTAQTNERPYAGCSCSNFQTMLPNSYDGLPAAYIDIWPD